eukprot:scaffold1748_cov123-Isochrysis_galbana.AAC.6
MLARVGDCWWPPQHVQPSTSPSCPAHRSCHTRWQAPHLVPLPCRTIPPLIRQPAFGHGRGHCALSSSDMAPMLP